MPGGERRMRLRRSNHHKEVIWTVDMFGKRGRHRDSSRVRVDVQYGVMRMLMVLRPRMVNARGEGEE